MSRNLPKLPGILKNWLFGYYLTSKTSKMTMNGLSWLQLKLNYNFQPYVKHFGVAKVKRDHNEPKFAKITRNLKKLALWLLFDFQNILNDYEWTQTPTRTYVLQKLIPRSQKYRYFSNSSHIIKNAKFPITKMAIFFLLDDIGQTYTHFSWSRRADRSRARSRRLKTNS